MLFKIGDAIVHPVRGAGIVTGVEERKWHGDKKQYYTIKLLSLPDTNLIIPTLSAKEAGIRRVIPQSRLKQLWRVFHAAPKKLPDDHKERYQLLRDRLSSGNTFQIAEMIRDMAWRQWRRGHLNLVGERLYQEGIRFLAGEIAATRGTSFGDAEAQVRLKLNEILSPVAVM